jgi:hypothetical protein
MTQFVPTLPLAPLIVAASACVVLWLSSGQPEPTGLQIKTTPKSEAADVPQIGLKSLAKDTATYVAAIEARPLLIPGRRVPDPSPATAPAEPIEQAVAEMTPAPVEQVPEPTVVETPNPPQITLLGLMDLGGTSKALLRSTEDQSEQWYSQGDDVVGWTLVEITQDSILLRSGETEIPMKMFQ